MASVDVLDVLGSRLQISGACQDAYRCVPETTSKFKLFSMLHTVGSNSYQLQFPTQSSTTPRTPRRAPQSDRTNAHRRAPSAISSSRLATSTLLLTDPVPAWVQPVSNDASPSAHVCCALLRTAQPAYLTRVSTCRLQIHHWSWAA
eukprot:scaffold8219_cov58-Phaeocystis_antarctica.AAC.5